MYLLPAQTSAKLLLNLVNDILDFSQIKEGKLRIVYQKFNIEKACSEALNLIAVQAKGRGIDIITKFDKGFKREISSDPNRLR